MDGIKKCKVSFMAALLGLLCFLIIISIPFFAYVFSPEEIVCTIKHPCNYDKLGGAPPQGYTYSIIPNQGLRWSKEDLFPFILHWVSMKVGL